MLNHVVEESIKDVLFEIEGKEAKREGLDKTPHRVAKAYSYIFGGYDQDPHEILGTTFKDGKCDEMVILKDIEFYSMCEHHILPFFGKVHIGYLPSERVVGISKLARLVDCFARRLQIQERLGTDIADTIMEALEAEGCMVVIEGEHLCMKMRGVEKRESKMITSAIRGSFKDKEVRDEFLSLVNR